MFENNLLGSTFEKISPKEISKPLIQWEVEPPADRRFLHFKALQNEFILTPDPRGLENTIRSSGSKGHTFPITGIGSGKKCYGRFICFFLGDLFSFFNHRNFLQGAHLHEKAVAKLSKGVFNHR